MSSLSLTRFVIGSQTTTGQTAKTSSESPVYARYDRLFSESMLTEAREWTEKTPEEIFSFLYQEFVPTLQTSEMRYRELKVERFNRLPRFYQLIKRWLGWKEPQVSTYETLDRDLIFQCERFAHRTERLMHEEPYCRHDMQPYIQKPRIVAEYINRALVTSR